MKFTKRIFLLSLVVLLLFTGCKNPFSQQSPQGVQPKTIVNEEGADMPKSNKVLTCDALRGTTAQEDCYTALSDTVADLLIAQIYETFDLNRCSELPPEMVDSCKQYIEESGVKGPISQQEGELLSNIIASGIPEIDQCKALSTSDLQEYCIKQVTEHLESMKSLQIIDQGDISECDTLTIEAIRNECKEGFGVFNQEMVIPEPIELPNIPLGQN